MNCFLCTSNKEYYIAKEKLQTFNIKLFGTNTESLQTFRRICTHCVLSPIFFSSLSQFVPSLTMSVGLLIWMLLSCCLDDAAAIDLISSSPTADQIYNTYCTCSVSSTQNTVRQRERERKVPGCLEKKWMNQQSNINNYFYNRSNAHGRKVDHYWI